MEAVVDKLSLGDYKVAFVLVPELKCMRWYNRLENIDATTKWYGIEPTDSIHFFVDSANHNAGKSLVTWFIVKILGK